MKILLVHPSSLLYSEVYLRLEPLGLEVVAAALEVAGDTRTVVATVAIAEPEP